MSHDMAAFCAAGLYDPMASNAADTRALIERLLDLGWTADQILSATADSDLSQVAFDANVPMAPQYTLPEAAEMLGISPEAFDQLRRTAGLAPRPFDEPAFTEAEVGAFVGMQQGRELFTMAEANHFARVLGSSMARVADAAVSLFLIDVEGPVREAGGSELDVVKLNEKALRALDGVASSLDPLLRMHMEDAIKRSRRSRLPDDDPNISRMCVGFIDLVGFTAFSERSSVAEIGRLVRGFEDRAYDLVADHGGRVVKLIGDEVMFVSVDPAVAVEIAMALIGEFRGEHVTPRGGLAHGELLTRGGDYYGPIVNLASRIGDLAVPCELLATPEIAERVPGHSFEPAGRRQLKGFAEPVALVSLSC
ncbi:MAG: adenylate/guanylate cyclase domain-containing protein [Actinomycetota bacterium]